MIEFCRGLVKYVGPALSSIQCYAGSPVIALDHAPGIGRINPQVVVIPVGKSYVEKRTTTIYRFPGLDIEHPESFGILWISIDMLVVPCPLPQTPFLAESLPALSSIVRAEEGSILCLDNGPDAALFSR